MMSQGQFIDGMDRIEAGHQRKMTKRTKDIWWEDCEEWNHDAFVKAINRLRRAEKWPNWNAIEYEYKEALRHLGLEKVKGEYCGYCKDGWLYYVMEISGTDSDFVALCATCHPNNRDRMIPGKPGVRFTGDFRKENLSRRQYSPAECKELWKEYSGQLKGMLGKAAKNKENEGARTRNLKDDKGRPTA